MMWRIYYDDSTTFSASDGAFVDAPTDGVQYITQKIGDKTATISGFDFYAMIDGEIIGVEDIAALLRSVKWIKHGRWTSHRRFAEIGRRVACDTKGDAHGD